MALNRKSNTILERIKTSEIKAGRMRYEALPQLLFIFGICVGFILNLTASIIFELVKEFIWVQLLILILSFIVLLIGWYLIHRTYVLPINKLEKSINKDFNLLLKQLVNHE